jgi:hypothetical protein
MASAINIFNLSVIIGMLSFPININASSADNGAKRSLPFGPQLGLYNFYGITATDHQNIWVAGSFGTIAHSSDRGKVWSVQKSDVTTELYDIAFIDDKTGWTVGRYGVILKTTDGGNLWIRHNINMKETLFGVCFVNSRVGWAVGDRYNPAHG